MYRGIAGIDALNESLQAIFNPPASDKAEIKVVVRSLGKEISFFN